MISNIPELTAAIETTKKEFDLNTNYFGAGGKFKELSNSLKTLLPEARPQAGKLLNDLKSWLNERLPATPTLNSPLSTFGDATIPGFDLKIGHIHPISQAMEEISTIFERIGFIRCRYPEVDGDYYVFEALNMPPNHPARDEWETFFLDMPIDKKLGKMVLSTHTSNGLVREMERLGGVPIRMINIARCYRRQADVTHTPMFHQFEGLVVDKGITIQHLKGTIDHFAKEFYGPTAKSRIRPFHFQFTEPSFEVDFSCTICDGTGYIDVGPKTYGIGQNEKNSNADNQKSKVQCRFCKSGWHEVGGAGMVHPNVLKYGGLDPEVYTGFAFGWGIERTYTLRPGLHIDDIRNFYNGDLKFLEQF